MNTVREIIEAKLENGVQVFTAHEVAHLLNQIRVHEEAIKMAKLEALISAYKEVKK